MSCQSDCPVCSIVLPVPALTTEDFKYAPGRHINLGRPIDHVRINKREVTTQAEKMSSRVFELGKRLTYNPSVDDVYNSGGVSRLSFQELRAELISMYHDLLSNGALANGGRKHSLTFSSIISTIASFREIDQVVKNEMQKYRGGNNSYERKIRKIIHIIIMRLEAIEKCRIARINGNKDNIRWYSIDEADVVIDELEQELSYDYWN